jgi:hypothetical protein
MISRDSAREIGNRSGAPRVPLPIAVILLAIGGSALWCGVAMVREIPSPRHSVEAAPVTAGKPVPKVHATHR